MRLPQFCSFPPEPRVTDDLAASQKLLQPSRKALCFFAGANSIFAGETLLTAENPDQDSDAVLFAKLGLKPLETKPR